VSRLHTDVVEVARRDDEPAQFLWRGRRYVVREVLARWTESGGWWRSAAVQAVASGDGQVDPLAPLDTAPIPSSPRWAQRAWGEPAPDVGAAVSPASVDDGEQDWFRVEAGADRATGSAAPTGVYDLCFDWSTGGWSLARVLD
jgi:hypothetical protein